ncbi:MAG: TonB-dependent receptor [Gemmatimonadaceae bacterium]|nr:TonB-dependent receptor [Gemmatimonadaceae bacterium]
MRPLFLLAIPSVLLAQSPAAPLSPVLVTATRVETAVRAPASVTVLSGDSLRARGVVHLADALRLVPGVSVVTASSFGSQSSLFVRGGQGNYVRVLLDGAPLNEPGGAIDLGAVTLDNIERVEIVRGPASVLYGADAVTGVVQLISRTGAAGARAALALDGGSHGQRDVTLSGALGGERVSVSSSLADRSARGILPYNNEYRNQSAAASLRLAPDAHTEAVLSARWFAAAYHYPTESDGSLGDHNAENTTRRLALAFSGRRAIGERLAASWTLTSSEHFPRSNDAPDSAADTLGFFGFFSRGTVTRRSAELRVTARAGATQSITIGVDGSRDHERSASHSLSEYGEEAGTFVAARNDRALYAQAVGSVGARGSYQFGARLDDNSAFGTFRTARLSAAWQLTPVWRARAAVGSAFRAPSFFENFAIGYVRGNAALVPEQTRSREVAFERTTRGATFSVTAYQQRFRDLIQYNPLTMSPMAPNFVNVAAADADGVEAEAAFIRAAGLSARLTYSYTRTRVTDEGFDVGDGATFVRGQPLVRRPAHSARVELSRRVATRADLVVGAAYTGRAHDRDYAAWPAKPVELPARTLVDLAANLRLTAADAPVPVNARLRVDNLSNVEYQGIYGFRAPGRSLRVGLTLGRP